MRPHPTDYPGPAHRYAPMYTPAELDRLRIEEFVSYEARDVAEGLLARNGGNRLQALAWLDFRWADETLDKVLEELVRREAVAYLLRDANPIEQDAHEATKARGVDTYEAALAAIALALTHTPIPEALPV